MLDSTLTRRRFSAYFAGAGLGSTLLPGVLWARMQEAGAQAVTAEMLSDALAISGLEFGEEERERMLESVNDRLERLSGTSRAEDPQRHLSALPLQPARPRDAGGQVGLALQNERAAEESSAPPNLEDVAFWTVRELSVNWCARGR